MTDNGPLATDVTQARRVLVLATLDTKSDEAAYLADGIRSRGHEPWLVDVGLRGGETTAALTRAEIAAAAGRTTDEIEALPRAEAMEVVATAAARLVRDLVAAGDVHAIIGIGGGTGTWLASQILATLPHGFPKLIVSTLTGEHASRDIMVLTSVVDIAGVNRLLAPVLANAAAAACGMAEGVGVPSPPERPTVALTMFGVTTAGATHVRRFLAEAGCEVVVFHANGTGGRTMEDLTRQGAFNAILDWTTSEITDELVDGICTAGDRRLEAAGELGVPQVVVPGAIDVINVAGEIPERFADRPHHWHLPNVPLIRTSAEESEQIGAWMGRKLSAATGPVHVLVPGRGFSAHDAPGGVFEDPDADRAWLHGLQQTLREDVTVEVEPHHINDEAFARKAADTLLALLDRSAGQVDAGGT